MKYLITNSDAAFLIKKLSEVNYSNSEHIEITESGYVHQRHGRFARLKDYRASGSLTIHDSLLVSWK